ncbi:helix-turn-helix domain-containing protein [Brevibacterium casei]|uniref:helix-turn-helix domain-containing protein n=1 Tax=Brevibacterium casei TaxID=33889 RepID=UPI0034D1C741
MARGLRIVSAVAHGSTTLKWLVDSTGIDRSSAHRMINSSSPVSSKSSGPRSDGLSTASRATR